MNIQTFSFANQSLQIIIKDNQAWFIAREVANLLGYRDAHNLTRILDDDEKGTHNMSTLGGNQDVTIINESGFYHAAFKSRKAEVKPFRKWVTNEVLPSIRKTGSYTVSNTPKSKTTAAERAGLRNAVNLLVSKKGLNYSEAYHFVHQRFNVESIEDLSYEQLTEAVEYVHRIILEGEVLDKPRALICSDPALLHNTLAKAVEHFRDYGKLLQVVDKLPWTDNRMAFHDFNDIQEVCENIIKIATDWKLKNKLGEPIFEPRRINFYNGAAVAW